MAERISGYMTKVKWAPLTNLPSTYGNETEIGVDEWSLNINNDLIDVTTTTDGGYRYFIPGLRGTEGSISFYHEDGTSLPFDSGDKGKLVLYVDSASNATSNYTVPCTLGSFEISQTIDGSVEVTVNYQGRGPIGGSLA
jgi:hypothetical protein